MPITYSMLIQFLTKYYKKGLTQKSIADLLRIDWSYVKISDKLN